MAQMNVKFVSGKAFSGSETLLKSVFLIGVGTLFSSLIIEKYPKDTGNPVLKSHSIQVSSICSSNFFRSLGPKYNVP